MRRGFMDGIISQKLRCIEGVITYLLDIQQPNRATNVYEKVVMILMDNVFSQSLIFSLILKNCKNWIDLFQGIVSL